MREGQPAVTRRLDYSPPPFWIDRVDLTFDLNPLKTRVLNKMKVRRNPDVAPQALKLEGQELDLSRVLVNSQAASFRQEGDTLIIERVPEGVQPFDVEIFTTCCPKNNSQLMGLYVSDGSFFTQCEAEGFRRITFFLDRPDVMAQYDVTIRADKALCPVLLSNGNLVEHGDLPDGRHFAHWHDPFDKPSYLFALVAGKLVAREQRILDRKGCEHLLQIYVRPGDLDKTSHAMQSLVHAIAWDEARFGLSLALERFMIVATGDFNMGAMENKGLNIFNTKFVLACPSTATDADYDGIESVIGHEYFHNWTGNRVTCRDWFQLSLKEGLTVFRDQEFSMDMVASASARAVKRISDVMVLRSAQFPEDAGPMAHPVRPEEYLEISNFYTATVYEKGAEVVRMMQTLVGRTGFRAGMDLYFQRHDGHAVTCDDFAQAIADANPESPLAQGIDQFKLWYSQSGTPVISTQGHYDPLGLTYSLTLTQSCPPTPGQPTKEPFLIPIRLGLVGPSGEQLPIKFDPELPQSCTEMVYLLGQPQATLLFHDLPCCPCPSILRGFSAPVKLHSTMSQEQQRYDLLTLLAHDSDPFNRWDAAQQLLLQTALNCINDTEPLPENPIDAQLVTALEKVLDDAQLESSFKALVLVLPREDYVAEQMVPFDPQRIAQVLDSMERQLAVALQDRWERIWQECRDSGAYRPEPIGAGRRSLAALALRMLCRNFAQTNDTVWPGRAYQRCKDASNMTEHLAALEALVRADHPLADLGLKRYYTRLQGQPLALDKWFSLQARAPDRAGNVLGSVRHLMEHPDFNIRNPNRARSLIFNFCFGNPAGFHRHDGAGYEFWAARVLEIDAFNPQLAARLARSLDSWARLAQPYRALARQAIEQVGKAPNLSLDVREVVTRALMATEAQSQ